MFKLNLFFAATFISIGFSSATSACPDLSGRYTHYFEDSDYRRNYCFKVTQNDCNSLTISNWSVIYKDGTVHRYTDPAKYPPRIASTDEISLLSTAYFKKASAEECE